MNTTEKLMLLAWVFDQIETDEDDFLDENLPLNELLLRAKLSFDEDAKHMGNYHSQQ